MGKGNNKWVAILLIIALVFALNYMGLISFSAITNQIPTGSNVGGAVEGQILEIRIP
jgi:general stress protein CsbA